MNIILYLFSADVNTWFLYNIIYILILWFEYCHIKKIAWVALNFSLYKYVWSPMQMRKSTSHQPIQLRQRNYYKLSYLNFMGCLNFNSCKKGLHAPPMQLINSTVNWSHLNCMWIVRSYFQLFLYTYITKMLSIKLSSSFYTKVHFQCELSHLWPISHHLLSLSILHQTSATTLQVQLSTPKVQIGPPHICEAHLRKARMQNRQLSAKMNNQISFHKYI